MNPELDLQIERVIHAPRTDVWRAWTEPELFAQWFLPRPSICRVEQFEPRPAGSLVTSMGEPGGEMRPHVNACFLAVDEHERIVFSTALDSTWRPAAADRLRMTATITFEEHADGTLYRAVVCHADGADRAHHEELGFAQGWGSVTEQLAELVEQTPAVIR
jgi:uncharacterized protein YndB with AHSA1/START domain